MKFENKGKWVRQILESREKQINEIRYINPDNLDQYNPDEIEEVTTASGEKRYRRKKANQAPVAKQEEPKSRSSSEIDDEEERLNYNDGDTFYHSRFGRLTYNADNDTFEDEDGDSYDADMIDSEELEEEPAAYSDDNDEEDEDDGWRPPRYRR